MCVAVAAVGVVGGVCIVVYVECGVAGCSSCRCRSVVRNALLSLRLLWLLLAAVNIASAEVVAVAVVIVVRVADVAVAVAAEKGRCGCGHCRLCRYVCCCCRWCLLD